VSRGGTLSSGTSAKDDMRTRGRLPVRDVCVDWKESLGEGVRTALGGYLVTKERRRPMAPEISSLLGYSCQYLREYSKDK